ncbi:2,3,4,5-tetrahydropyridine-2,6-dicarboxylate N-acetyltransferase [Paenibacillus allorhizoplanae]|uniref:2,3,4,5-tetrahydropyridine-2,6-dicarboxylate N-acetyltransferase n=1 Tax=Paenibacillus allorhizoplanae TaxID=2905648 RepID=A0ABN8GLV5_9BACL|nr:acyltransferase [Paenibacillus allorhizoplanae]CAH1207733.1 2,3,4,5-tetrahydropyridine-2,6-dicarboxylate N-acetyltransferase [Paenibacillus allorhizoplanae]
MLIIRVIRAISVRIKNKLHPPKSELEQLRDRGLKYGKNFEFYNSLIDQGHCWLVEIGDDVTITNSTILAHDASMKAYIGKSKIGKVKIGDRVFIGFNSVVLCNVTIGNDVIVAAGSIVTKSIPDNSIVAGNPARVIGKTSEYIEKHKANLAVKPVFETYWPNKTQEQIKLIQEELQYDFGYDE